jgi:cytochrome c peroxidase
VVDLRDLAFPKGLNGACKGKYAVPSYDDLQTDVDLNYNRVGLSIAAFEASAEVNPFSSKFDLLGPPTPELVAAGDYTAEELLGWNVFNAEDKGNCAACHPSEPGPFSGYALFTDYTYDNLGIPANPLNPVYANNPGFIDFGLGEFKDGQDGKVKVPTLRNVAKSPGNTVKAFGHNGVFKSLEQIVHFYNTAGTKTSADCPVPVTVDDLVAMGTDCWPEPEVGDNVNRDELGDLGLTAEEEAALVAFMKTLSDGWTGR